MVKKIFLSMLIADMIRDEHKKLKLNHEVTEINEILC